MTTMTSGEAAESTSTGTPAAEWGGKNDSGTLLVCGLLALIIGSIIVVAAWPGTEVSGGLVYPTGAVRETGSMPFAIAGAIFALGGQVATTIAVIAYGVRLGNRP